MSEKKIIIIISIFILMTFSALSWREMQFQTGTYRSGWWGVYFNDPKGASLDFTIENEGKPEEFLWKIIPENGDSSFLQGSGKINPQEKKSISVPLENIPGKQKIIIEVSDSHDSKKDIYKTLP